MQFRVYDKKQKKYLNPSNLYISAGGKKVICPEIFFDNSTLGAIDPSRVCVEYGMKGFDGSGKMFYEGDVFAVPLMGVYSPYFLKLDESKGFYFHLLFKDEYLQKRLTPLIHVCQMIGNIHDKSYKQKINELNDKALKFRLTKSMK